MPYRAVSQGYRPNVARPFGGCQFVPICAASLQACLQNAFRAVTTYGTSQCCPSLIIASVPPCSKPGCDANAFRLSTRCFSLQPSDRGGKGCQSSKCSFCLVEAPQLAIISWGKDRFLMLLIFKFMGAPVPKLRISASFRLEDTTRKYLRSFSRRDRQAPPPPQHPRPLFC